MGFPFPYLWPSAKNCRNRPRQIEETASMSQSPLKHDLPAMVFRTAGRTVLAACASAVMLAACGRNAEQVGAFSNDWTGNEIKVEALHDPDIPNVVCHITYFDRSVIDRLRQGNWF